MRAFPTLLFLTVMLAGCSDSGERGATEDPTGSATPTSGSLPSSASGSPSPEPRAPSNATGGPTIGLTGCRNFGGVFPVPMDAARAVLPDGFEPVATPSDPAGGATLYVLGVRCAGSSVDGNDTGEATLGYAELAVVAPADQAIPGLRDATVPLFFAATPEPVGAAFAAFRLGQSGFGAVGWAEHTGAGDVIVSAEFGGASFTLRGAYPTASPGGALGSGNFALYGVQDGVLLTKVIGSAAGGEAVDTAVTLESAGLPLLGEARPVVRGFTVAGFDLAFRLAETGPPQIP